MTNNAKRLITWEILLAACKSDFELPSALEVVQRRLKDPQLDWADLTYEAVRQRVVCRLGRMLLRRDLQDAIPDHVLVCLFNHLHHNKAVIECFEQQAELIWTALDRAGVRAAVTKGLILNRQVYGSSDVRQAVDLDFMICPGDVPAVQRCMDVMGYSAGNYDYQTGEIHPYPREWIIRHKLNPDHLPAYVGVLQGGIRPFIHVDFATSFVWARSGYQDPVVEAIESAEPFELSSGVKVLTLRPEHHFLFVCLHLFREAWIEKWADNDVSLAKFLDVWAFWRVCDAQVRERVNHCIRQFSLEKPMAWVLCHTDAVFGGQIAEALSLCEHGTEEWLASANVENRGIRRWSGSMAARLMSSHRSELLV